MRVPAFDPRPQNEPLLTEIKAALAGVLESGHFIGGPELAALEREFADHCGTAHAVGTSSGTDALLAVLMALGVGPGDRVLTTPFTFFGTAGVVARLQAVPVFCDVEPDSLNLAPAEVRRKLERERQAGRSVKALLPVHLFGQMADMQALGELGKEFDVPVVEDACQAIGAEEGGRRAGSLGRAGCFSFYPTKNLGGLGDGGMITTNDPDLAGVLVSLRNHGMAERYEHTRIGGNFRLDALQAAALRVKLPHLSRWTQQRQQMAARYDELLLDRGLTEKVRRPMVMGERTHVYHQYVVRVPERDSLRSALAEKGIGTAVYYPIPLHQQPCFRSLGHEDGDFPEAERAAREVLALPIYPGLSPGDQEQVVLALAELLL